MKFTPQAKLQHQRLVRHPKRHAALLVFSANDDYLLCRVGLTRWITAAFIPGHQAIEKYLKAFIVFADPEVSDASDIRRLIKKRGSGTEGLPASHNLLHLYAWAAELACLPNEPPEILKLLNRLYVHRYPDNPVTSGGASSSQLAEIDSAVMQLWQWFDAIEPFFFLTHGPFMWHFAAVSGNANEFISHFLPVISDQNPALLATVDRNVPRMQCLLMPD